MDCSYKVSIIGLGYIGLPLSRLFLEKGHTVFGIDIDKTKIDNLLNHQSYLSDFTDQDIKSMFENGRFYVGDTFEVIKLVDVVIICVPTPIDDNECPDLTFIREAIQSASEYFRQGQLVILESSTYPGTTEEELLPIIESKGLKVGSDIALVYSPERINPGQKQFHLYEIPKVVGGITQACSEYAKNVYGSVFNQVVIVSSARIAEMTKLVENSQRFINISFMNELAMLCDLMAIDLWEVIHAASTKPFGFTPYFPGPGVSGHCIPVDPLYLSWKAKSYNFNLQFIELAHKINEQTPNFVINKVEKCLASKIRLEECKIYVIGVTFKKDVNDLRESRALKIIEGLMDIGADVSFYDPYVNRIKVGQGELVSKPLTVKSIREHDCALILTDHSNIPYKEIVEHSHVVIDTRNATKDLEHRGNVTLL